MLRPFGFRCLHHVSYRSSRHSQNTSKTHRTSSTAHRVHLLVWRSSGMLHTYFLAPMKAEPDILYACCQLAKHTRKLVFHRRHYKEVVCKMQVPNLIVIVLSKLHPSSSCHPLVHQRFHGILQTTSNNTGLNISPRFVPRPISKRLLIVPAIRILCCPA